MHFSWLPVTLENTIRQPVETVLTVLGAVARRSVIFDCRFSQLLTLSRW